MSHQPKQIYEFGAYRLDAAERLLLRDGGAVSLQPKVFDLLRVLVEHHGHLLEKDELMKLVWPDAIVEEANLANNISILRKTLSENGERFIETVPKRGYRFVGDVREMEQSALATTEEPYRSHDFIKDAEPLVGSDLEIKPEEGPLSVEDLAFPLAQLPEPSDQPSASLAAASEQVRRRERRAWIVSAVFALVALVSIISYFRQAPAEVRAIHFSIPPPEKATGFGDPVISPDGRTLAFTATAKGKGKLLWVRPLDSLAARPLAGTEGASFPFWSPTGEFLGFFAQGKLKRIALSGGLPTTLCEASSGRGGAWGRNEVILFVPNQNTGVQGVSAAGGSAVAVTTLDRPHRENTHRWPSFLPDGRHFLYRTGNGDIYLAPLDGEEAQRLVSADSGAVYTTSAAGTGYLLFMRGGTLLAQPFNAHVRQLTGEAFRVADQVNMHPHGKGYFSVSENGVLVYGSGGEGLGGQLGWFDRAGKQLGLIGSAGNNSHFRFSPDEKRVAVTRLDLQTRKLNTWLLDLSHGADSRLSFTPGNSLWPIWSPDGSHVIWNTGGTLYQKASSGAGQEEVLLKSNNRAAPWDWSGDGRLIVYETYDSQGRLDLWLLPLERERRPKPWLETPFNETNARFSPDSRWLAYTSDESKSNEVYVQAFPAAGGKRQISTGGADHPRFRRDGKELFYLAADGKLMAVEVKGGASFEHSAPRSLFDLQSIKGISGFYDVTRDGQRFLVVTESDARAFEPFTVVLNWTAELKR